MTPTNQQGEQPCENFAYAELSNYSGLPIYHDCVCGKREEKKCKHMVAFCKNCFRDHKFSDDSI